MLEAAASLPTASPRNHKMYPNPVSNILTVSSADIISYLEVIDIVGKKVMELELNDKTAQINVNELNNGIYFVRMHTEKGLTTQKIQVKK